MDLMPGNADIRDAIHADSPDVGDLDGLVVLFQQDAFHLRQGSLRIGEISHVQILPKKGRRIRLQFTHGKINAVRKPKVFRHQNAVLSLQMQGNQKAEERDNLFQNLDTCLENFNGFIVNPLNINFL